MSGAQPAPRAALPAILAAAVATSGEMGRRFAEFDWDTHPLGPIRDWPAEYCAAVATALTSRFPIVLWLGAEDLFLVYNDDYIPMLGDKHPAALGGRGGEVWWDIRADIEPMLSGVLATGEATWSDDLPLVFSVAGRPVERYFTFSYSPMFAASGAIDGIFCAVTETTDRVLGERRLAVLNAVAARVLGVPSVDAVVAGAVAVCAQDPADLPFVAIYAEDADTGGPVLRGASPAVAALLPRELSELTAGRPVPGSRDTWEIEELAAVLPGLAAGFEDAPPERALVLPLGAEATSGVLVLGLSPRRPLDEQYRGFCQLLADQLSSALVAVASYELQRHRADELAALDRAKTEFLSNVSHEFRTPLTLLLGPIDDALADVAGTGDPALVERLTMARRNAGRLRRLVDSMLDFSRIEAGRAHAEPINTDVGALTAHIASSFSELCRRAGLRLVLDCEPAVAAVDPAMWETIMFNLLSNAVKFTFSGSITVRTRVQDGECRIVVRDTGIGIAPHEVDRIFERFHRGDNTRGRSVEGAGVGLALVRGLVDLHGGSIRVESAVGQGTSLIVTLPSAIADPDTPVPTVQGGPENPYVAEAGQWVASGQATGPQSRLRSRALILVVDDNADMRGYLHRILSRRWDTVLVSDGRAALDAARARPPDAVVTDVMMPGLNGFELVAALRADPLLNRVPVVMLSARSGSASSGDGYANGADDYLVKPFSSGELLDRVAARLAGAERERDQRIRHESEVRRETASTQLAAALRATDSTRGILDAVLAWPFASDGAHAATIGVIDTGKTGVRVEFLTGAAGVRADRQLLELSGPSAMAEAIRTGAPIIVADTDSGACAGPEVPPGARSGVIHPLRDADYRMIGALARWWPEPRDFTAPQLELLAGSAQQVQSALHRVQVQRRERRIALEFQDQLLDLDRSSTSVVVAGVYQPAEEAMRVGGDWYLAVPLDRDGRLGVSVGDVVGHGLSAAVVMSRLRAAIAAAALSDGNPGAVLDVVNRYAVAVGGAHCATAAYAVVDPAGSSVEYCCAGHPYPLLIPAHGTPTYLDDGRRPPLATSGFHGGPCAGHADIPPGSTLLLYTDGLIEHPGQTLDEGFDRLRAAAEACATLPTAALCTAVLDRLRPPGGYADDVVLLAVRPTGVTADTYTGAFATVATQLPIARTELREWLRANGVPEWREYDILLAVGEAMSNSIEHGSRFDARRTVSVEATRLGASLLTTVTDSGAPAKARERVRDSGRGRGLPLMKGLADHVAVERGQHGTTVTLRFDDLTTRHPRD